MNTNEVVGRIRKLQMLKGLSNNEFAELLGISPAALSHIYNGRNAPSMTILEAISRKFPNVNFNHLIKGEGNLLEPLNEMKDNNTLFSNQLTDNYNTVNRKDESGKHPNSASKEAPSASANKNFETSQRELTNENISNLFTIVKVALFTSDGKVIFYTPTQDFNL
ncbi:helix-turn-helix domain-containing protein [Schleiferia thermophila]|jgi:transcriptional regulator with XRE-family HTH domain|uniref:helix-turn-helix domain-containing protein n=1 Tax=Schleiferia thermophila TaxID=884107 RepID=UPI0004E61240|nr:helix-turn-helix transcriptional regulator [Schleiferia thermophila]KFD40082.1 DNA-binding protein [Schleiferia thermophila str. Yellowstone]